MRITSILIWMAITVAVLFGAVRIYYYLTDDFRIAHLSYPLPFHREWEMSPLSEAEATHLRELLQQTFSYIGKGEQAYVFGSADGQYVIKFFKFKHLKPNPLLNFLPSVGPFKYYKEKQAARKVRKIYTSFEGHRVAYQKLKEESGLLFVHLNRTTDLFDPITLIDKMGWKKSVDLDKIPFIIQKRARTSDVALAESLRRGDLKTAESQIQALLNLYLSQYHKGIVDNDDRTIYNTGFIEDQAVQVDVGNLKKSLQIKELSTQQKHLSRTAWTLLVWANQQNSEAMSSLKPVVEAHLSHLFSLPITLNERNPPVRIKL